MRKSGKGEPCPVCDRTKDSDCRVSEDGNLVLCHTHQEKADPINGFRWIGVTTEGAGWGKWIRGFDKNPDYRPQGMMHEFPYTDASGTVRTTKKRIYKSSGKQDWWDPKGVPTGVLLPYRYLEACERLERDPSIPLFIDESEMTVDLLWDLGLVAIAFGRSFPQDKIQEFVGRYSDRVVVCCDQDKPGLQKIQKYLKVAQSGRVLKPFPGSPLWDPQWLPESQGLDVRDWVLAEGITKDQILVQVFGSAEAEAEQGGTIEALSEKLAQLRLSLGTCSPLDRECLKGEIQAAKIRLSTAKDRAQLEQRKAREKRLREKQAMPQPEKDPRTSFEKDWETANDLLEGRIRYNLLKSKVEIDGSLEELEEPRAHLAEKLGASRWYTSDPSVLSIVVRVAKRESYCPVKEYLESVQDVYPYPEAVPTFADILYGTKDPLSREFLRVALIGAVRRIYEPGCQHRYLLILQSDRQKVGKSTSLRLLFGDQFFGEGQIDPGSPDSVAIMAQNWCHEIPEIDEILHSKSEAKLKFWISAQGDTVRLPYAHTPIHRPRRGILIGTTNERELLRDPTGSSRYPIISIPAGWEIPTSEIPGLRDSIWSAVLAAYRAGESNELSPEFATALETRNQDYQETDPWEQAVLSYLRVNPGSTCAEILVQGLRVELGKITKADSNRVGRILRKSGADCCHVTKPGSGTRKEWSLVGGVLPPAG